MLSRVCTLLNCAFLWNRLPRVCPISERARPHLWLGQHLVPPQRCESIARKAIVYDISHLLLFVFNVCGAVDLRFSSLLGTTVSTLTSDNVPYINVTLTCLRAIVLRK